MYNSTVLLNLIFSILCSIGRVCFLGRGVKINWRCWIIGVRIGGIRLRPCLGLKLSLSIGRVGLIIYANLSLVILWWILQTAYRRKVAQHHYCPTYWNSWDNKSDYIVYPIPTYPIIILSPSSNNIYIIFIYIYLYIYIIQLIISYKISYK